MDDRVPFRVGLGFDFHRLADGRRLILGGVEIPHDRGLEGHSDADALLHAVGDALLGAAGLKDIGSYFPDNDDRWKDVSSVLLLEKIDRLIRGKGFTIGNLDVVVLAEEPMIQPHVEAICSVLSRTLRVDSSQVSIKATTMEGCGVVGRGEGIAVQAVVLLVRTA